jgi:hypothetical protein
MFFGDFPTDMLAFRHGQAVARKHLAMTLQTAFDRVETMHLAMIDPASGTRTLVQVHHFAMGTLVILATLAHLRMDIRRSCHALDRCALLGDLTADMLALAQGQAITPQDLAVALQAPFHRAEFLSFSAIDPARSTGLLEQIHGIGMRTLIILATLVDCRVIGSRIGRSGKENGCTQAALGQNLRHVHVLVKNGRPRNQSVKIHTPSR